MTTRWERIRYNMLPAAMIAAVVLGALLMLCALPIKHAHAGAGTSITCDGTPLMYDASTSGSTRIFTAGTTGRQLYICGYMINLGGTATNVQLKYGTGTNCGTGTTNLTPNWNLTAAGAQVNMQGGNWEGLTVPPGNDLCIVTSTAQAVQALFYVTFF